MELSDKGLKAIVRGLAKLVNQAITKDEVFAEEVRALVHKHVQPEKEDKPPRELTEQQKLVGRIEKYYAARHGEMPPAWAVMKWLKALGGDAHKLRRYLDAMNDQGNLKMPWSYQVKVMHSWIERGGPLTPSKKRRSHTTAGGGQDDDDIARLEREGR